MADKSDQLGSRSAGGIQRTFPYIALIVIGLALWSWSGGLWDVWSRAEAGLIQAARGAFPGEGWPLPRWICFIALKMNGGAVSNWAVRLPSVIFGIVALAATFRIGARLFGESAGWLAALVFASMAGLTGAVPAIYPGMMLTAWIALALDLWIERPAGRKGWPRAAGIAMFTIAAVFTTGWLSLVIIAAVIGGTLVVRRAWSAPVAWVIVAMIALIDGSQRAVVLTTLLPPVALIVGIVLNGLSAKAISPRAGRRIGAGVLIVALILLIGGIVLYIEPDDAWKFGFFVLRPGLFLLLLSVFGTVAVGCAICLRPKTSTCIASLFTILFMANAVVSGGLKPAMNPIRSGAIVAEVLDHAVPLNGGTIGVLGRAYDPRFHVYGRYHCKTLAEQPAELANANTPAILIVANQDLGRVGSALHAAGYMRTKRVEAIGERLVVMRRGQPKEEPPNQVVRLFALGDTGTGENHQYEIGKRMGEVCDKFGPMTACLLLGDNLYDEDALEVGLQNRFLKPFDPLIKRGVPCYAAIGNHDYKPAAKFKFEINTPWFNMGGHNYYSKTFGNGLMTVFFLDCETLRSDPAQYLWLKHELMNCTSTWKVLINHVPMVASNVLHADNPAMFDLLDQIMVDGKIDLVLSGHNHLYERRALKEGIQYMTVGCGGHVDHSFEFPADTDRVIGYHAECCFSWMEVSAHAIRFQVNNEDGVLIDEFSLSHGPDGKLQVSNLSTLPQGAVGSNGESAQKSTPRPARTPLTSR